MGEMVRSLCQFVVSALRSKRNLALENAALRHQLMVLQRQSKAPRIENRDRLFWISLMRLWPDWRSALSLVQPATVVRWHRKGFRAYWRWKSRTNGGRPRIGREVRGLVGGESRGWTLALSQISLRVSRSRNKLVSRSFGDGRWLPPPQASETIPNMC